MAGSGKLVRGDFGSEAMIERKLKNSKSEAHRLDKEEARPGSGPALGLVELAAAMKIGRGGGGSKIGMGGVELAPAPAHKPRPLAAAPILLLLVVATFHPAARLVNCSHQQETQPASSVWFMAAQNSGGGSGGSHIDLERQQQQQQQAPIPTPITTGNGDDKTQPIRQRQPEENERKYPKGVDFNH